jgi:phage replication O-like protein O
MNQLVAILDAALAADLGKRQWAAFAAVLRQTLGYRKVADDISPRRLEQLTGIQRNHIWQAKNELLAMGLLTRSAGRYGEVLGFPALLGQCQPDPPLAPALGADLSQFGRDPVPKQDTTLRNLTPSNQDNNNHSRRGSPLADCQPCSPPDSPPPDSAAPAAPPSPPAPALPVATAVLDTQALEYPASLSPEERRVVATHLDGLSPQGAQDVLDVLAAMDARGEVRKSRIGLLFALVKAQRQGVLDVSPAVQWRQQRERQRAAPVQQAGLERAGELAWVRQLAALQGLPLATVAAQLGVRGWPT